MSAGSLGLRELNRATLERQLLLRRAALPAADAIGHLGGLQAQAPLAPYLGLWTRLSGFRPDHLKDLLTERSVVRAHLMRNTVHLVTAGDFVSFRPLFQPVMERGLAGPRNLDGVDLSELTAIAAALLGETALTRAQLARRLAPRWPDRDPASLAHAATHLLPLVQAPPRGLWGSAGQATFVLAAAWLDGPPAPPEPARAVEQLVLRYLAAYGPASVADIQAWSGLSRLREVTERLRARLRVFTGPAAAAARPAGRAPAGTRRPGAAPLPARLRQPAALLRRTQPGHPAPPPGPAAAWSRGQPRHAAHRRALAGRLGHHRGRPRDRALRPVERRRPGRHRRRGRTAAGLRGAARHGKWPGRAFRPARSG